MSVCIGIDVGGSSIKAAVVDLEAGELVGEAASCPTPSPATLLAVGTAIGGLVTALEAGTGHAHGSLPVGIAVPSVVRQGITHTAANIDAGWVRADARSGLAREVGRPVVLLNDGDAAGLAEMRLGAGRGQHGTVLCLTFGTGIGSALFVNGVLMPNTELGHLEIGGAEAEHIASGRARRERGLDWPAWSAEASRVLKTFHALLWPELIVLGGGLSDQWEQFGHLLQVPCPVVPAGCRQHAGVIGAALAAAEGIAP